MDSRRSDWIQRGLKSPSFLEVSGNTAEAVPFETIRSHGG